VGLCITSILKFEKCRKKCVGMHRELNIHKNSDKNFYIELIRILVKLKFGNR
jgi:hypothetical protein